MADDELLARALGGDGEAFARLFARFEPELLAIGRDCFGAGWLSQEVVEETRLLAWRHLADLREPAAFGAWLRQIARHWCHQRRRAGQPLLAHDAEAALALLVVPGDPAAQVAAALEAERLLARLAPSQRQVVELCLLQGHSLAEAGSLLGLTPTVVKGRLQRARASLRQAMAPSPDEESTL